MKLGFYWQIFENSSNKFHEPEGFTVTTWTYVIATRTETSVVWGQYTWVFPTANTMPLRSRPRKWLTCEPGLNFNTVVLGTSGLLQLVPSLHNCPTKQWWGDRLRDGRSRSVAGKTSDFLCTGRRDTLWGPTSLPNVIFQTITTTTPSLSFSLYCTQLLACPITVFNAFTHSGYNIFHLL
jgi:hypothetical protein